MQLDEQRIQTIVAQVMEQIRGERRIGIRESGEESSPSPISDLQPPISPLDGVFPDIDSAIKAATTAQKQLEALPLERREALIASMRRAVRENAQTLAYEAWQETGMGRYEDKIEKNLLVANKTPGTEDLKPTAFTGDRGLTLVEHAPYGVVGAITPSTNPTSTIINNALGIVAAGNAVVFNAHPGAKQCSVHTAQVLNRAITRAGGPPNTITLIPEPTIESAQYIMKHPGIKLLLVTGGPGVVKVAMASGKKAICAGPGNPPVVVDETADMEQAARDIVKGASFDNNLICVLEKEVLVVESVAERLKAAILACGAVELTASQVNRLLKVILAEDHGPGKHGVINKEYVGKNVSFILKPLGLSVGDDVRLAIAEVDSAHQLVWTEQLMPVLPLVRVRNADEAIDLAKEVEHGYGHTAVMHSKHLDHLSRMAREIGTCIFVKNGPSLAGLAVGGEGYTSMSIASPTGEGLTSAKDFARVRRCTLVDSFRIV